MTVTVNEKPRVSMESLFGDSDTIVQMIAQVKDASNSFQQRQHSLGFLKGCRNFYRVDGKEIQTEYLGARIIELQQVLRNE